MVKSGLQQQPLPTDVPRVSQYRLAAHLGSAFILYSMFLWQGLTQFIPINNVSRSYSSIVYYYHIYRYLTEAGTRINHNSNTCICPNVDLWKIESYMTAVTRIVCMYLQLPNTSQMRRLRIMAHSIKGLTFVTAISGKYVQLIWP